MRRRPHLFSSTIFGDDLLSDSSKLIYDTKTFVHSYHKLNKNDIILGTVRLKPGEEHLLTDLLDRGIQLIPTATAQLASRSKVFQANILKEFMLPGTMAIYDKYALLEASTLYQKQQFTRVILKQDRKNAGLGIHIFNSVEDLYNHASCGDFSFPFVIQPFQQDYTDIRVLILDDYHEAYQRINPHNFRNNLHCGGRSAPCTLTGKQLAFCKEAMARAGFTWAHLDLMLTPAGDCWLTELNLNGGLRGAQIPKQDYKERIEKINRKTLSTFTKID